jgi:outer membrane protein assembly factor BamB
MSSKMFCSLSLIVAVAAGAVSYAQDWPQWRGPNRDGVVASFSAPKMWPDKLTTVWKVQVGAGHSSPIVAGNRVYVFSRQQEIEAVSCFDLDTGKQLWRNGYPAPYTMNPAAVSHGKGPKSTPLFYNNKLYTLGISGILSCYDAAKGALVWRKEFGKEFKTTSPLYGAAMSPLGYKDMVIAHVGGHDSGALIAFNADNGSIVWRWAGDGPGYASPVVFETGGVTQIVTQTQRSISGFSAADGNLQWRIPFETEYDQNIVTPLVYKDALIFSGIDKGTTAVKVLNRSGKWVAEQAWVNPDVSMYMNSPVLDGDYLFGLSHKRKGQIFCLDARTGKMEWASNGRDGDNAAMVRAGNFLFMLNDSAELTVVQCDPKRLEIVKKYTVADSSTWAHPVIVGNRILVKDDSSLALLSM